MSEFYLGCLIVVLLFGLIDFSIAYYMRLGIKKQIKEEIRKLSKEEKEMHNMHLNSLISQLLFVESEISDTKSMVDELAKHNSDISDVVDRAAKQYQEEISSLFGYCGENRSNE